MWMVGALLVLGAVIYWHSIRRGRLFVQAACFLKLLYDGASEEQANQYAASLHTSRSNPDNDAQATALAMDMSSSMFNGKQLPLIQKAREMGFGK